MDTLPPDTADKPLLRKLARSRRASFHAALPEAARRLAFRAVPTPLLAMIGSRNVVALYLPVGDEAPAARFAAQLWDSGRQVCCPRVIGPVQGMDFRLWKADDPLEPGPLGTRHPAATAPVVEPDVIIAPLLAFDRSLNRLGQGGGYYDRAFARLPDALRIGMGWSVQEMERLPADPWDMPLDAVVTECEFIEGARRT